MTPVALDEACADLVNQAPVLASSLLAEQIEKIPLGLRNMIIFIMSARIPIGQAVLRTVKKSGLVRSYELIKI